MNCDDFRSLVWMWVFEGDGRIPKRTPGPEVREHHVECAHCQEWVAYYGWHFDKYGPLWMVHHYSKDMERQAGEVELTVR